MPMNMPNVLICSSGSVSSALLRLGTRWGLKCSILVTVLSTRMESIIRSGFAATDAKRDSIWIVSPLRNLKHSNGHSCVPSIPVGSSLDLKRVTSTKRVVKRVKRVIFPISVAKEKVGKKRIKRGKDGRTIPQRKPASSGKGKKEQEWTEEDMEKCFELWEHNDHLLPGEKKMSKRKIAKNTGVPYTTVCERLSGRRGGGRKGKIAGGKRLSKVLTQGKQAGSFKRVGSGPVTRLPIML